MSAVSNVSHRQSHKRQQPSQANYWGRGAAESGPLCEHPSSRWSKAAFCVAGRSASPVRRAEQAESQMIRSPERQWLSAGTALASQLPECPPTLLRRYVRERKSPFRTGCSSDSSLRKSSGPNTK